MKNKKLTSLLLTMLMSTTGCVVEFDSSSSSSSSDKNSINSTNSQSVNSSTSSDKTSNSSSSSSSSSTSSSSDDVQTDKYVYSVAKKSSFVNHEDNKKEKTNKKDEFFVREGSYKVGDDNAISYMPILTSVIVTEDEPITDVEKEWNFNAKLYKYTNNEFTLVNTNEYMDSTNYTKCEFDFNEAAVSNTFKLSLTPKGLTTKQQQEIDKYTVDYVVEVVDGYNVTSAKELAYIQNKTGSIFEDTHNSDHLDADVKTAWDNFKTENNLQLNYYPSSMILHNNLSVTKDDVPKEYFYSESEVAPTDADYGNWGYKVDSQGNRVVERKVIGSLKDRLSIYYRIMEANSTFNFEGNFFKLDVSNLPTIVREENTITAEGKGNSHSELFKFEGDNTCSVSFSNFKLDGNAPKNNDTALSGGLIFIKTVGELNAKMYNNIAIRWFITYFNTYSKNSEFVVEKCKLYDNFTTFFYVWGSKMIIKDSEANSSGGPAIIQDHVGLGDEDPSDDYISTTEINNSKIEAKVTGSEGWFNIYGASALVPQIKGMDAFFNPFGRSFLTKGQSEELYFNLIAVNKSGSAESVTADPNVRGTLKVNDYSFDYGASNPLLGGYYPTFVGMGAPMYETNAGGCAYYDGKTAGLQSFPTGLITDPTNSMFQGDKLCLYYNGMAILFDYGAKTF